MAIDVVGPWLMLGVGLIVILGAVGVALMREKQPSFFMWVFGVALMGVGSYGPVFLEPYRDFLNVLAQAASAPTAEAQEQLLNKIATTNLPPEYRQLGLNVVLSNPIPETGQLLTKAIDSSTDDEGKQALTNAKTAFNQSVRESAQLAAHLKAKDALDQETVTKLDRNTQLIMKHYVAETPNLIRELNLDRTTLERFRIRPPN